MEADSHSPMRIKPHPNRHEYLMALARMTPAERLAKADELTEMSRSLCKRGLRRRFPDLSEDRLHDLYLARLEKCHNRR